MGDVSPPVIQVREVGDSQRIPRCCSHEVERRRRPDVFRKRPGAGRAARALVDVGLGYLALGQPSSTLSGAAGGYVVAEGTPHDIARCEASVTGRFLRSASDGAGSIIPCPSKQWPGDSLIPEKFKFCSRFAQLGHCRELGHDAHIARRGIKN